MLKSDLSSSCLDAIRASYHADGRELFTREYFLEMFPGVDGSELSRALEQLAACHVVNIFHADDVPSTVTYLPGNDTDRSALQQLEEEYRKQGSEEVPEEQPQRRKTVAVFRFVLGIAGTVIATLIAYWIMMMLRWM